MKKFFAAAVLLVLASTATFGATLMPIQLLNPAGSSSNQVIASSGPTTAPAWVTLTAGGLGGLTAANNLSDLVSAATARTNLGLTSAATTLIGTSGATIPLLSTANTWTLAQAFTVRPTFNGATPWDSANLSFAAPPAIGGTTPAAGAFTTLSASSTVSGVGFSTYLASPPAIGGTAAASGKFTTLQATSTITPSTTAGIVGTTVADSANAGSDGEYASNSTINTAITSGTTVNATSVPLTAGDWDCRAQAVFVPAATTVVANIAAGITTTSATLPASPDTSYLGVTLSTGTNGTTAVNPLIRRINVSSATTVYVVAEAGSVTTSTATVNGYIQCRRVR